METTSARPVVVEPGGTGVVAHVGLHALCSFADRLGLGDSLSSAIPIRGERSPLHDRGKVLVQQMATIAGGGESCADIEYLRAEETLFGFVPSDSTVWRTFHEITPETRAGLKSALADVREKVWARSGATTGYRPGRPRRRRLARRDPQRGERGHRPDLQGRVRFPPTALVRRRDRRGAVGDAAAGQRRVEHRRGPPPVVTDEAIAQLPAEVAAGHHEGDDPALVRRDVVMRADSAGCTEDFLGGFAPATSASPSSVARTPRWRPRSSTRSGWRSAGRPRSARTASCARARR